jgi:hypothetical protein
MSLRWWQNWKRSETIQRRSARSSAVLLKKERERDCHPTARALLYENKQPSINFSYLPPKAAHGPSL